MKKKTLVLVAVIICLSSTILLAKTLLFKKAKVDFDAYEKLVAEVKEHRKDKLVNVEQFKKMSSQKDVIILDTRSDAMFNGKHIKGAKHLNFSDFTQDNLAKLIPDKQATILIYCNNNFDNDEIYFAIKISKPLPSIPINQENKEITLALNIPTYINLYGYGYKNVYELSELVNVFDGRIEYEGTSVAAKK